MKKTLGKKNYGIFLLVLVVAILLFGYESNNIFAQTIDVSQNYLVVGSNNSTPLDGILNITKVAYPSSLPSGGGVVTFIYKITNSGVVSLSNVRVVDDKCSAMSGELGDTNNNHLLDPNEIWIYNCSLNLKKTTTDTATVTAFSNNLNAVDTATTTVEVAGTSASTTLSPNLPNEGATPNPAPSFPDNGPNPNAPYTTLIAWGGLGGILLVLVLIFFLIRKKR
jgi:hypothetical protein